MGEFFVPLVYILMGVFFTFNICFVLKGLNNTDSMKWRMTVEIFEVVGWVTVTVWVALNAGLFYFGEYVETSHEAFILLFFWVNGFVGPFVLLSFGFLGLLHFQTVDQDAQLKKLSINGNLAIVAPQCGLSLPYNPYDPSVSFNV
jgi:hypothetical protein